jgi:hypothetical protein
MMRFALLLGIAMLAARPAAASFHLWDVSEVYTNADGSVQFIEFFTTFGSQQFLIEHQIQALTEGVPESIYTIPANLPLGQGESTANRHFVFASGDFEADFGIAPDYAWTGALSFINVGTNDSVALIGADALALAALPTDGTLALLGDGATTAAPTPTNFAGEVGTLPEPGAVAAAAVALGALGSAARLRRGDATRSRPRRGR